MGRAVSLLGCVLCAWTPALGAPAVPEGASAAAAPAWWVWPLLLFVVTFVLGMLAVLGGVGGGVLFVPIVGSLFPFHMDFVRGASLLVALSGALGAGPGLLRLNLAHLRLALPPALVASTFSIAGALIGLALPQNVVQVALGATILLVSIVFVTAKNTENPQVEKGDRLACLFGIHGAYQDPATGKPVVWSIHRTPLGFALFSLIGLIAGMFGLGAGWANVPVLNLLLGVPLKVAVGTSIFLLSITDTSAAWVYLNRGAVLPIVAAPSVIGMMLGSFVGVRLLAGARPKVVRHVVVAMLLAAGTRAFLKGLGIWE